MAKLAKLTIDLRWEDVFRRYDAKSPWERGSVYIMSNNSCVRRSMYGFKDPALEDPTALQKVPPKEFTRMLAAMLMDGARVDHSEYKFGLYQLMRNPQVVQHRLRDHCRVAIAHALRPRDTNSLTADGSPASATCPALASREAGQADDLHYRLMSRTPDDIIPHEHRDDTISKVIYPSLVARKVPKAEMRTNPDVIVPMKDELFKQLNAP